MSRRGGWNSYSCYFSMQKNSSKQHQLGMTSCIYNHPKVMLTECTGMKTFLHIDNRQLLLQWMTPEGVEGYLLSFPIGLLLQKAPHLETCWKMNWLSIQCPLQNIQLLWWSTFCYATCLWDFFPMPSAVLTSVVALHSGRKGLAVTFLICLQQITDFHLKFTTSTGQGKKKGALLPSLQ